jgi:cell division protein FtsL
LQQARVFSTQPCRQAGRVRRIKRVSQRFDFFTKNIIGAIPPLQRRQGGLKRFNQKPNFYLQNFMAKNLIQKAEEEILKGRTHQELFNEIVAETNLNIHDVADAIRKIPSNEKRKKYLTLNFVLIILLIIIWLYSLLGVISNYTSAFQITPLILLVLLIYMVIKYKPNAHYFTGGLLFFGTCRAAYSLIFNFSVERLMYMLFIIAVSGLAFYLGSKLTNDYILNKELLKENPNQRVGVISFTE